MKAGFRGPQGTNNFGVAVPGVVNTYAPASDYERMVERDRTLVHTLKTGESVPTSSQSSTVTQSRLQLYAWSLGTAAFSSFLFAATRPELMSDPTFYWTFTLFTATIVYFAQVGFSK